MPWDFSFGINDNSGGARGAGKDKMRRLSSKDRELLFERLQSGDYSPVPSNQGVLSKMFLGDKTNAVNQVLTDLAITEKQRAMGEAEKLREQMSKAGFEEDKQIREKRLNSELNQEELKRKREEELRKNALQGKALAFAGQRDFNAIPSPLNVDSATPEQLQMNQLIAAQKFGSFLGKGVLAGVPEAQAAAAAAMNEMKRSEGAAPLQSKIGATGAQSEVERNLANALLSKSAGERATTDIEQEKQDRTAKLRVSNQDLMNKFEAGKAEQEDRMLTEGVKTEPDVVKQRQDLVRREIASKNLSAGMTPMPRAFMTQEGFSMLSPELLAILQAGLDKSTKDSPFEKDPVTGQLRLKTTRSGKAVTQPIVIRNKDGRFIQVED